MAANNNQLGLKDLFELAFEITKVGGQPVIHTDIDGAASNGTTMTIKALTNMYLLLHLMDREQAGRIRLPYYLDEAADIDERNQQALIETSLQLGFVPILASVKPQVSAHVAIDLKAAAGQPASTSKRRTGNTSAAANRSPASTLLQPNGPKSRPDHLQRTRAPRAFHTSAIAVGWASAHQ